jgi:hypothetical protein
MLRTAEGFSGAGLEGMQQFLQVKKAQEENGPRYCSVQKEILRQT